MYPIASKLSWAFAVVFAAGVAAAQTGGSKSPPPIVTADITFSGGTLDKYVDLLRQQFKEARIVVDGFGSLELPAARLPKTTLPLAMGWVQKVSAARGQHVIFDSATAQGFPGVVYIFTSSQSAGPRVEDRQVKPFYLSEAEEKAGISPTAVKKGIEDALAELPAKKATVKYDGSTRLLIVAGTRGDIQAADSAYEAMTRGRRIESALPQLQGALDKLRGDVGDLKKDVDDLKKKEAARPAAR